MKGQVGMPNSVGLYNPAYEHDACGVAMVVDMHQASAAAVKRMARRLMESKPRHGDMGLEEFEIFILANWLMSSHAPPGYSF